MNYKIFLISRRSQGAGIRCQGSGIRGQGLAPEGGQAAKESIYEKNCSNANLKLNSFANLSIAPVPPKGDKPEK